MSYQIKYRSFGEEKKGPKKPYPWLATALLVIFLFLGAMTVKYKGLRWVTDYLLPGDPAVTAAALESMAEDLKNGESLPDAVAAFCRQIMEQSVEN